jgi:FHA domain
LEEASGRSDDYETVPSISPDLRAQLKAAVRQSDDNETVPSIAPDLRKQLQSAVFKTVELDPHEFDLEPKTLAGNALLKDRTTVVFALIDSEVLLPIHIQNRLIIGRLDVEGGEKVDVDLTPYGGRERGVSRRHVVLYRTRYTVSLADLNSSNGTYLNGVQLVPHQPRLLREGDEVRLGNMRFHTYFDR